MLMPPSHDEDLKCVSAAWGKGSHWSGNNINYSFCWLHLWNFESSGTAVSTPQRLPSWYTASNVWKGFFTLKFSTKCFRTFLKQKTILLKLCHDPQSGIHPGYHVNIWRGRIPPISRIGLVFEECTTLFWLALILKGYSSQNTGDQSACIGLWKKNPRRAKSRDVMLND